MARAATLATDDREWTDQLTAVPSVIAAETLGFWAASLALRRGSFPIDGHLAWRWLRHAATYSESMRLRVAANRAMDSLRQDEPVRRVS